MYSTMESLRTEIEQEMKRTRLDKDRLYGLLLKIFDKMGTGPRGPPGPPGSGPQGPTGPPGPRGATGPACECKCSSTQPSEPVKAPTKPTTRKAPTKKKVVAA